MTANGFSQDVDWLPEPGMTPVQWLHRHNLASQAQPGPRDSRIPSFLGHVAAEVCALRFSLERLRLALGANPRKWQDFRGTLLEDGEIAVPYDVKPHLVKLLESFLSRGDWREVDVLEMMLEYLGETSGILARAGSGGKGDGRLREETARLKELRTSDGPAYARAIQGLITETRGSLMGLTAVSQAFGSHSSRFHEFTEELLRMIIDGLAQALGAPRDFSRAFEALPEDPGKLWEQLLQEAGKAHGAMEVPLSLKPLEKASLILLEGLPLVRRGHAAFVRHLIEREDAYRGILATCYAPRHVRAEALFRELERFNNLPEYATRNLHMDAREADHFLYAFMLRPDVVSAIAEREQRKDIYSAMPGLGFRAHLPRVLHEIQNIFGYVTPEAVQRIVHAFQVEPMEVIRIIASYKQFSADRGGDVIIYVCKGTACFLRGQPELSRKIADEIMAEEGQVGRRGIQFIEMDCFGVCHLAPVVKARDTFLGRRKEGDIPYLQDELLRGPSYENHLVFLERIQRMLAPGHVSDPIENLRIKSVVDGLAQGEPSLPAHQGEGGGYSPSPSGPGTPAESRGDSCLQIDASGQVFACSNSHRDFLGRLMAHSLCFHFRLPDGVEQLGALVLDGAGQVESVVNFPFPFSEGELHRTLKPRGYLAEDSVWVDRFEGSLRLGNFTANAMVVEAAEGGYRIIELSAPPNQAPPEREHGLKVRGALGESFEDEAFLRLQDRLLLGFSAGADPENIEAYVALGGYGAVRRVLGLDGEAPWKPGDVVDQIAAAGLRGRGGAGFPTGRKWDAMRKAACTVLESDENQDPIKLIVANGDEGDPGA
ncbi:MAG: hypothetical protein HGA63_02160, partial [Syntrophobacteraceae bacterium]|nr:hypothetical protein [Syntrophobacteraceae bacterium]